MWKAIAAIGKYRARDVLITVSAFGLYLGFCAFASV